MSFLSNTKMVVPLVIFAFLASCAHYQARRPLTFFRADGVASWYGPGFSGRKTASGEKYNPKSMTAAHRTLPFGTTLKVTNTSNGKWVVVRINDRGPFVKGRIIDVSKAAAVGLGMTGTGTAPVQLSALEGPDKLIATAEF